MATPSMNCVLLADRHHRLIECVRDMLESEFSALFIVSNENSLIEGAARLLPKVAIIDTALVPGRLPEILEQLLARSPDTKTLLLSVDDQAGIARFGLAKRANGVVLKRALATDLFPAIDAILANRSFVSPGIGADKQEGPTVTGEEDRSRRVR